MSATPASVTVRNPSSTHPIVITRGATSVEAIVLLPGASVALKVGPRESTFTIRARHAAAGHEEHEVNWRRIGSIGNYYGAVQVAEEDGKFYWGITDWTTSVSGRRYQRSCIGNC